MTLDLPGSHSKEEFAAMKRLARELAADGYRVARVGVGAGGEPAAIVYARTDRDPIRAIVIAARSLVREVERLGTTAIEVTADDYRAIQALETTSGELARNSEVRR